MHTSALPGAGVLLAAMMLSALAQGTGSYDPDQLPAYHGQIQLFTLTPHGDIDGLVLIDGTEVKTPPHLSTQIALIVRPGDAITVHGLKAAKVPLIRALSVTNDRDGKTVVDKGAMPYSASVSPDSVDTRSISGRVRMVLHGPQGELNGVLLEDGTILKLPPPDVSRFQALLTPGSRISVEGNLRATVAGTVVEVTALGPSPEKLQPVD